jgi:hypothetical protein
MKILILLLAALSVSDRIVYTAKDTLTAADCGGIVVYQSAVQVNVAAPNLPAGCFVTLANNGAARAWITVTEPGFATTGFGVPPTRRVWMLHTAKAANGSWFAALKSQ